MFLSLNVREGREVRGNKERDILWLLHKKYILHPVDELRNLNDTSVQARLLQVGIDVPHLISIELFRHDEVSKASTYFKVRV
jgi:hypothetical protein